MSDDPKAGSKESPWKPERLREMWPQLWEFIGPRRWILILGFVLMGINRVAGLVLPYSSKYLIDDVIGKRHVQLLEPLILAVLAATLIQGVSSFALTQILSKEAQRLIAELRTKVQAHVGRLSLAFYDANKTGALVSRIMSDVEGLRNLIGTGLVQFVGGLFTTGSLITVLMVIVYVAAAPRRSCQDQGMVPLLSNEIKAHFKGDHV